MRNRVENIVLKGASATLLQFIVIFAYRVALVPVFLLYWGTEKYGVWLAVMSVFNLLVAIDAGHANYVANEFTRFYHTKIHLARRILGSAIRVSILSGLLQLSVLCVIAYWGGVEALLGEQSNFEADVIKGLAVLVAYRMMLGGVQGILVRTTHPVGMINRSIHIQTGKRLLKVFILIWVGLANWSVFDACLALAIANASYAVIVMVLLKRWVPEVYPFWSIGSIRLGVQNYVRAIALTLSHFLENFRGDGVNLIVTAVLGPATLPLITTLRTIAHLASRITIIVMTPVQPELTRYHFKQEFDKIVEALKINWLIAGFALNAPFILLPFFVYDLYGIWTGGMLEFDRALFICFVTAVLLLNYGSGHIYYLRAINQVRGLLIVSLVRGVLLLGLSFLLLQSIGLIGLGIAMILVELVTSVTLPEHFVTRELKGHSIVPRRAKIMPLLGIASTVFFMICNDLLNNYAWILGIVTLIWLAVLAKFQYRGLSEESKTRLSNMIKSASGMLKIGRRLGAY